MSKVRYNGVADALQGRMGVVVFRRVLGREEGAARAVREWRDGARAAAG